MYKLLFMKFIQGKPLEMQHLVFKGDQETYNRYNTLSTIQNKQNITRQICSKIPPTLPGPFQNLQGIQMFTKTVVSGTITITNQFSKTRYFKEPLQLEAFTFSFQIV